MPAIDQQRDAGIADSAERVGRVGPVTDPERIRRRRPSGPPVGGWGFGASGIPAGFWVGLASLLIVVAIVLLAADYTGYGAMLAVLGLAAAANLIP